MITVEINDLNVLKHIQFTAEVDPTPWAMGPISTQQGDRYTKAGSKKKVSVGESESARNFKDVFSMHAARHRISSNSPYFKNTPIVVFFAFYMSRPQGVDGPALPLVRPDTTNMQKLAEDTLTGLFWDDDNTTVDVLGSKRYVVSRDFPPCIVTDVFYCELKNLAARPGGFSVKQKGSNMVIIDGHEEENKMKAAEAEKKRKQAEQPKEQESDKAEATTTKKAKKTPPADTGKANNDQSGRVV